MDDTATEAAAYRLFAERGAELASPLPVPVVTRRVERAFMRMCRWFAPTVSLELGAHEARFSRRIKRHLPDARALAFEANPYVVELYAAEAATHGVEYVAAAVAATNGTVDLTIPTVVGTREAGRTTKMASLGHHRSTTESETVTVPSVRLDDYVTLAPEDRVVSWIDVEGASEIVLTSSRATLARTSLVYMEVETKRLWNGQWLDRDVAAFFGELGLVPVLRDIQRPRQYNVIFAREDLAAAPFVQSAVATALRPED